MNIVNKRIKHAVFGEGKVISQDDKRLNIQFSNQYGTKQFIFPDAFKEYLELSDNDTQLALMKELNDKQAKIEADILQVQEENKLFIALKNSGHKTRKKKSAPKRVMKLKSESDLETCEK